MPGIGAGIDQHGNEPKTRANMPAEAVGAGSSTSFTAEAGTIAAMPVALTSDEGDAIYSIP
jgi:hypothetical protein